MLSRVMQISAICLAIALAVPANAATITFNNETDFLSAITPTIIESFESYSPVFNPQSSVTTGDFTVTTTPTGGGTSFLSVVTAPQPTDGVNTLGAGSDTLDPWFLTFVLNAPTNAVGFYLTDAAEAELGSATIITGAGDNILIAGCCLPDANILFFGLINTSQSFTTFTLINTGIGDGWGIDKIQFAQIVPVPEPETYTMLLAGLLGLGAWRGGGPEEGTRERRLMLFRRYLDCLCPASKYTASDSTSMI